MNTCNYKKSLFLSSYPQILNAFSQIKNIHEKSSGGELNILHYIIREYKKLPYPYESFKKLMELGVDIDAKDKEEQTPLHYAAIFKNFEIGKLLIDAGAEIDAEDINGNTPLWRSVMYFRGEDTLLKLIKAFLNNGADINKKNKHDSSPKDVIIDTKESISIGGAKKEWDLSEHLTEYLK